MHDFERTPRHERLPRPDSVRQSSTRPPFAGIRRGLTCLTLVALAFFAGCAQSDSVEYTEYVSEPEQAAGDPNAAEPASGEATAPAGDSAGTSTAQLAESNDDTQSLTDDAATAEATHERSTIAGEADAENEPVVVAKADPVQPPAALGVSPAETNSNRVPPPPLPTSAMSAPPAGENGADTTGRVLQTSASLPLANGGALASDASPAAATADPTAPPEATGPREVKLLVKDRKFSTEGPDGALRISYDDFDLLKILNMEPVTADAPELLPDWLRALDGKRVRVRGFMYPPFEETGLRGFVLARDNQICCFGRNPKVYDLVEVTMRKGVTTNYIQNRPFDVVGIFRIEPDLLDGELFGLYKLEDAIVIDD